MMVNVLQELTSTQEVSQEITKDKKKREKPVAMSLSEFRQTGTTEGIQCAPKSENLHSVTGLDSFLEWPDDSTIAVTLNRDRSNIQGQITTSCHSVLAAQSSLQSWPEVVGTPPLLCAKTHDFNSVLDVLGKKISRSKYN